jgi:hypothetical protein
MRSTRRVVLLGLAFAFAAGLLAQGHFEVVTGKAFDAAMPNDFYLEGNRIPTEKRNAALVMTPAGKRLVVGLIDTAGYSSEIKKKYSGMIITESEVSVCGHSVGIGSYGFGVEGAASGDQTFHVYNQAGEAVLDCSAPHDAAIKAPRPLQVKVASDGAAARLYLGRNWVELK